jgi:hypothetical protein
MKTRTGFVSNSSSTSFIVAFPGIPESWTDTLHMMFPNETEISDYHVDIAKLVWRDIQDQKPNDLEELYDEQSLTAGAYDENRLPLYWLYKKSDGQIDWEVFSKIFDRWIEDQWPFLSEHRNDFLYHFTYEDSEHYDLESGQHFDNLPHETFNHH